MKYINKIMINCITEVERLFSKKTQGKKEEEKKNGNGLKSLIKTNSRIKI